LLYGSAIAMAPASLETVEPVRRLNGGPPATLEVRRKALWVDERWVILVTARDVTERLREQARIERFASALDLSEDAFYLIDRESMRYIDVNRMACTLQDISREELMQQLPHQGSVGISQAELEAHYDRLIEQSPATETTERAVSIHDGTLVPCEVRRQALRASDGRWVIVASLRDIRERKKATARMALLARVLDLSADAMILIDPDEMHYIEVNEMACRLLGRTAGELVGRHPWEVFAEGWAQPASLRKRYDDVIAAWPAAMRHTETIALADGEACVVDWARQALKIDGRVVIAISGRDVTEQRRNLAHIERLARAIEMSEDAIAITDRESMTYLYVNPAMSRLVGVAREQLIGVRRPQLEAMAPVFDEVIRQAPAMQKTERDVRHESGTTVPCEVRRQALVSEDRWIVVSNHRDISERRRAEEDIRQKVVELMRSNQELEQFAYVTSHDLSEPLRMVASYTQLLERRYSEQFDQDAREFMGYIVGGAQRMKQLIDDLLLYSRAGRPSVQMKSLALDRALDDALANLAHAISTSGAIIERSPLPRVVADKSGMVQVFQNLIGNAIKFRAENTVPVVRVQAEDAGTEWLVSVSDNGIGIAPEYFQRIFVIFQRLHARTRYEGTGIGLSICKKVVERHGGRIEVTSEPGQGTTFHIHLPKNPPEADAGIERTHNLEHQ
jgi:PAS domain S-box-containing protein